MPNADVITLEGPHRHTALGFARSLTADSRSTFVDFSRYRWELESSNNIIEGIVGTSPVLMETLDLVRMVAPTNSTVLIEGETGTGKELIARAIHVRSRRRDRPFIKLNCAAIPAALLESELFGHERGAFTGAVERKAGRFELADGGTLFLDEIGDMPLELQAKLLRVLQEREFERLGGSQTRKIDVRVVAATNQDLESLVTEKQFRRDLYYRLNVFPISLPPLRERREDIPLLIAHFVKIYAERVNKEIRKIESDVLLDLQQRPWPGNIRELQNVIERAAILTFGDVLSVPNLAARRSRLPIDRTPAPVLVGGHQESDLAPASEPVTLEDAERAHILKILSESNGVIGGPKGAAARLGIPRTTLIHKMRKRGLSRSIAAVTGNQAC